MERDRLRDLIHVLPDPMLLIDGNGAILYANPAVLSLLDLDLETVTSRSMYDISADSAEHVRRYLVLCAGSRQMMMGSVTLRVGDAEEMPFKAQGATISPASEAADALLVIRLEPRRIAAGKFLLLNEQIDQLGLEIHKRKQVEDELRVLNAELERRVEARTSELSQANRSLIEKNRELQEFAYVASHDLQEPLRKIRTFLGLVEEEMPERSPDVQEYFNRIDSAAARMSTLITDLLSLSRIATDASTFQPTDLTQIVNEVIVDLEVHLNAVGGRIDVGALPTIDARPVQMRQLFQNLIDNSLKFHRPDVSPHVVITAEEGCGPEVHADTCRIAVKDNGIGFSERHANRIFMPFQRLHGRGEYPGSGIGLAICRRIVERHGGSIAAEGTPGEGSRIIIDLPLRLNGQNADVS